MSQAAPPDADEPARRRIHRGRYLRVLFFFFRLFLHIVFWDVLLARPGLRLLRTAPEPRWVGLAAAFRRRALRWGGVFIKLGQYLSTRVDVLPLAVTRELAGLQDEVPPEDFTVIRRQVQTELGRPLQDIYSSFLETPLGAASFAQVHEAQLPSGEPVVVKVLRPGIESLVETDLEALGRAIGWLAFWPAIRRRIDLEWLEEEFARTTRRELDLEAEAEHAERFAENFAEDGGVHIPRVYRRFTSRRVLTEENVAFLKITDLEALRAYGIDPRQVAKRLYRIYMRMIFDHHFVHADPHPGNLFVRPLSRDPSFATEMASRAGEAAEALGVDDAARAVGLEDALPEDTGVPFQILLCDFGMVAEIPPRLRAALRKYLIGIANRDPATVVQALRDAGSLLPGADLAQLEEVAEAVFERFWGVEIGRLNDVAMSEATTLWKEFGELLRETPIQVQVDLIFTSRAIELLVGITRALDEEFNPWHETVPFAQRLAFQTFTDWRGQALEAVRQARALTKLPAEIERTLGLARRGRLTLRTSLSPGARRQLERLERSNERVAGSVVAAGLLVAGAVLHGQTPELGLTAFGAGLLVAVLGRLRRR
ncbi:MAG: AarF/UbiB family protein [Acidobacteriota bacterium]